MWQESVHSSQQYNSKWCAVYYPFRKKLHIFRFCEYALKKTKLMATVIMMQNYLENYHNYHVFFASFDHIKIAIHTHTLIHIWPGHLGLVFQMVPIDCR